MALRRLLIGVAIATGLFLAGNARVAEASHDDYLVQNSDWNPNGSTNPNLWGVQLAWVINGQPLSVCSDWGTSYSDIPAGVRQAIADWEAVLPGTQFSQDCGAYSDKLWFKRLSLHPSSEWPCANSGAWACAPEDFSYDTIWEAYYPTNAYVWIDDVTFAFQPDNGWRYIAATEIGHHFGLDDNYIESPYSCNLSGSPSVMNAGMRTGQTITGPCSNGSVSPTSRDTSLVQSFFNVAAPSQFKTLPLSSGVLEVDFNDPNWAESGYHFYAYRYTGSYWAYTGDNWVRTLSVGSEGDWNNTDFYRGSEPEGYYILCSAVMTGVYGESGWACAPSVNMADHDPAADWVINVGPAAVNLSDTNPRIMWTLGEISNQGDHGENVAFSFNLAPPAPTGCSRTTQLILPGTETYFLFPGEARVVVYRTFYECHAPAAPPYFNQTATLTVSHPGGGEPLGALGNNSAAQSKFVIIQ
jgi:hypothetical protein